MITEQVVWRHQPLAGHLGATRAIVSAAPCSEPVAVRVTVRGKCFDDGEEGEPMDAAEMLRLFESHREAQAAWDIDAILETFVSDCFLETVPLGLRSEGKAL
jgi:hypothetical protein